MGKHTCPEWMRTADVSLERCSGTGVTTRGQYVSAERVDHQRDGNNMCDNETSIGKFVL